MRFIFSEYFLVIFIVFLVAGVGYIALTDLTALNQWISRIAHFSGGFWAAALFIYIFLRYPELEKFSGFLESKILFLILVLGFAALIGVFWELFEFIANSIGDLPDTIEDLSLDLIGAFAAALLGILYKNKK